MFRKTTLLILILILLPAIAAAAPIPLPNINIGINQSDNPTDISAGMKIIALLTILSLAPAILVMLTGFTRIVIVFHFLRQALGTQQMPPNQVIIGLSLFITFLIMSPYFIQMNDEALQPYLQKTISQEDALKKASTPLKAFMRKQKRKTLRYSSTS